MKPISKKEEEKTKRKQSIQIYGIKIIRIFDCFLFLSLSFSFSLSFFQNVHPCAKMSINYTLKPVDKCICNTQIKCYLWNIIICFCLLYHPFHLNAKIIEFASSLSIEIMIVCIFLSFFSASYTFTVNIDAFECKN